MSASANMVLLEGRGDGISKYSASSLSLAIIDIRNPAPERHAGRYIAPARIAPASYLLYIESKFPRNCS